LRYLDLSENDLGPAFFFDLAVQGSLSRLRALDLGTTHGYDEEGEEEEIDEALGLLVQSPQLQVEVLGLGGNDLGPSLAEALGDSSQSRLLRSLDLSFNSIGDEGIEALVRSPNLGALRELDLSHNGLTSAGCRFLAGSSLFAQLEVLTLGEFEFWREEAGLAALATLPGSSRLRTLTLEGLDIAGIETILRSSRFPYLNALRLTDVDVVGGVHGPEEGAVELARLLVDPSLLKNLTRVWVEEFDDSPEAQAILRARWPLGAHCPS